MKRIDGKFHIEARSTEEIRIVKTSNGDAIPDDEPLILFRARDHLALPMLRAYRVLSIADGCNDFHIKGIDSVIGEFERFTQEHSERMKQPGITRGL